MGPDAGQLYAMKVLKKASLKGKLFLFVLIGDLLCALSVKVF